MAADLAGELLTLPVAVSLPWTTDREAAHRLAGQCWARKLFSTDVVGETPVLDFVWGCVQTSADSCVRMGMHSSAHMIT